MMFRKRARTFLGEFDSRYRLHKQEDYKVGSCWIGEQLKVCVTFFGFMDVCVCHCLRVLDMLVGVRMCTHSGVWTNI